MFDRDEIIEVMARALYDLEPLLFPKPDWMTYDILTEYGKEKYRKRAAACFQALQREGML